MNPSAKNSFKSSEDATPGFADSLTERQTSVISRTSGNGKGLRATESNLPDEIVIRQKNIQHLTATIVEKVAVVFNEMLEGKKEFTRYQVQAAMRLAGLLEYKQNNSTGNLHIHLGVPRPKSPTESTEGVIDAATIPLDERTKDKA